MTKRKVFLAYGYSAKNAGDLAICVGAIDLLVGQGLSVTLLSKYDRSDTEYASSKAYYHSRYGDKVKVLEAPFTLNRKEAVLKKFAHNLQGLLVVSGWGNPLSRLIEEEIKSSDLVIFNGGNLLRCSSIIDYVRLVALYYPIKLAKAAGKQYLIFPHSSAHINKLGKGIIGRMVRGAKAIFAREDISYKKLKNEFRLNNIHRSIDLAFFTEHQDVAATPKSTATKKVVGFTFRAHTVGDIEEFSEEEKGKIYHNILSTVVGLGEQNRYIFVVQTLKDRDFTLEIKNKIEDEIGAECEFFENYDPIQLIQFYRQIDLLIGMRLHSIILATSVGTPAYGIFYKEWGLKNPGLMEKLELPYVFMDDDVKVDIQVARDVMEARDVFEKRVAAIISSEKSKLINALH